MKTLIFSKRNIKEFIRDPLTLVFSLLLPVFIFLIMTFMTNQLSIPNPAFEIGSFAPATVVFAFSFLTLFSSMLISKDRTSAFLTRMKASPLKSRHFILGYTIPLIFMALVQNVLLFLVAIIFGLPISANILLTIILSIPVSVIFSSIGLIFGSLFSDKQASGFTSILIQLVAFTSGMWFDLELIGGGYKVFSYILPFAHCVDLLKKSLVANFDVNFFVSLGVVFAYAILLNLIAIISFKAKTEV